MIDSKLRPPDFPFDAIWTFESELFTFEPELLIINAGESRGRLRFESSSGLIDVDLPIRPYKSIHRFSIDIEKTEENKYLLYDNGAQYDTSSCEFTLQLPLDQALGLQQFIRNSRTESFTMSTVGAINSGFYPFLPHRGTTGPFQVSLEVKKFKGFQEDPYRYYDIDLKVVNVGTFPFFNLINELWEGDVSFAGINNLRYSPFDPQAEPDRAVSYDEKTFPYYSTHKANADPKITKLHLQMNLSKAMRVTKKLLENVRTNLTSLSVPTQQFPFGEYFGDNQSFNVKMIQDTIEIVHQELNEFSMDILLSQE